MPVKLCMSVTEMAERLGISLPIAYRITRRKDFPSFKVGNRILIPLAGLEKWINDKVDDDHIM